MPCLLCVDVCSCASTPPAAAAQLAAPRRWLPDAPPVTPACDGVPHAELPTPANAESAVAGESQAPAQEDSSVWRQEVAARLNRYHSRRKPRPPRYPSLRLKFEDENAGLTSSLASSLANSFARPSNQALALDEFSHLASPVLETPASAHSTAAETYAPHDAAEADQHPYLAPAVPTAKIIEFPRSWTPPAPPPNELAEPVMSRPRILEAPEVVPPPPALGGITIEPAQQPEFEKRPGIDIPLQSAPLTRRILSAMIDDVIITAACLLFGFIFWKLAALRPPHFQLLGLVAGLGGVFWATYQYLLVVYASTTPGLRMARLELCRFDGNSAGRKLRRWRVLASFLSALSLGMGYAWVFLDEDALCWHDRITHTYLAPKSKQ